MNLDNIDYKEANELFLTKIASASGMEDLALAGTDFIRTKIQEESMADRVIEPQDFTAQELSVELDKDRFFRVIDIKPEYKAQELNWDSEPTGRYIHGKRGKIQYLQISTPWYQKTEQEIRTMNSAIIDQIQQDGSKYFADVKDSLFMAMCAAASAAASNSIDHSGTAVLERTDFNEMASKLTDHRLRMIKLLITDTDVRKAGNWPSTDVGSAFSGSTTREGFIGDTLEGFSIVKTVKTDILAVCTMYGFTTPEYLGYNEYLVGERPRLELERRFGKVYWRVVGTTGMYIANVNAIVELKAKPEYV